MKHYLVVIHHMFDDLPVALFGPDDQRMAAHFASTLTVDAAVNLCRRWKRHPSEPHCVTVVEFEGGVPRHESIVVDFLNPESETEADPEAEQIETTTEVVTPAAAD